MCKKRKTLKIILSVIISLTAVIITAVFGINAYVRISSAERILSEDAAVRLEDVDSIIVLGCGVHGDTPSHMLEDRLLKAIEVRFSGVSEKLLMSGDHGRENYDEVNVMKNFAMEKGIEGSDIFMDHAGFSTYDSLYRASYIFGCKKVIIVTQKYHLYRALYIAKRLGIEAYGVNSDQRSYKKYIYREAREILARDKDFFKCIWMPESVYLGEKIPISGDGNATNDK